MATDLIRIVENLRSCYSFRDRALVIVGAGGGQIVDVYSDARHVVAVDPDAAAMARLEAVLIERGLRDRFELLVGELARCDHKADVVLFELCLHEIPEPRQALAHARLLASEILVYDHAPGSPWAWQTCEEDKAARSWAALAETGVRWRRDFHAEQVFRTRAELEAKVASQGPEALERAGRYAAGEPIRIAMDYFCALI